MTDNEIIKALECCGKDEWNCDYNCPFFEKCSKTLMAKSALDLINRQKAEIERLQKNIDGLNIFTKNHIKVIRLQAIKEFAERLKAYAKELHIGDNISWLVLGVGRVDQLVKEMEEVKENV